MIAARVLLAGATVLVSAGSAPTSGEAPIPLPACVQEFAAREVARKQCLRVVADDAKYDRCLATLKKRPQKHPDIRVCYQRMPAVCVRLGAQLHHEWVVCQEQAPSAKGDAQEPEKAARQRLARAAKTCERLLEDVPRGERALRPCHEYDQLAKRKGREAVSALARAAGMGTQTELTESVARCEPLAALLRALDKSLKRLCAVDGASSSGPPHAGVTAPKPEWNGTTGEQVVWWIYRIGSVFIVLYLLGYAWVRYARWARMQKATRDPCQEPKDPEDPGKGPPARY